MESELKLHPIGYYRSPQKNPAEAGRQPDAFHSPGVIELSSGHNFEQALTGLDGFDYIWIVFQFHLNSEWKPMVLPPRGTETKQGVFATRSPYRPNPIGISVARLEKIEGLKLHLREADLLDGSPILDIKPYLAYVDAKPEASSGWLKEELSHLLQTSAAAEEQLRWLEAQGVSQLRGFLHHQLEFEPTDSRRKRVKPEGDGFVLAYRTWRAFFVVNGKNIEVQRLFSGYTDRDLAEAEDTYQDKDLHRRFQNLFTK